MANGEIFYNQAAIGQWSSLGFEVAAHVPAVELSATQWERIQFLIRTLAEMHDLCPRGLDGALIEGRLLAEAAKKAAEIRHLGEKEQPCEL